MVEMETSDTEITDTQEEDSVTAIAEGMVKMSI